MVDNLCKKDWYEARIYHEADKRTGWPSFHGFEGSMDEEEAKKRVQMERAPGEAASAQPEAPTFR